MHTWMKVDGLVCTQMWSWKKQTCYNVDIINNFMSSHYFIVMNLVWFGINHWQLKKKSDFWNQILKAFETVLSNPNLVHFYIPNVISYSNSSSNSSIHNIFCFVENMSYFCPIKPNSASHTEIKVQLLWEGHKIWINHPPFFEIT